MLQENPPHADEGGDDADTPDGGYRRVPPAADRWSHPQPSEGGGYGVGSGTGSAGILQDPEFLLYYKTVQDQIKKAWTFTGGSSDLTATVDFAIGPDGTLTASENRHQSSKDATFDDSVVRAIRRAAPFPAPPEKFRDQFSAGSQGGVSTRRTQVLSWGICGGGADAQVSVNALPGSRPCRIRDEAGAKFLRARMR